jgi:hypothetical protein
MRGSESGSFGGLMASAKGRVTKSRWIANDAASEISSRWVPLSVIRGYNRDAESFVPGGGEGLPVSAPVYQVERLESLHSRS